MENSGINEKIIGIRADIKNMLLKNKLEPYAAACLDSALAHIELLYIELGLDLENI